jgi:hypothetical protein
VRGTPTKPCDLCCWLDETSPNVQGLKSQTHARRYKVSLDPTIEDVKKLCLSCRRNAKGERVLLHYNGHGVPRPTANGEVWVFNKNYTQYIPLSVYDLQTWAGMPSIYVFDCSAAGVIIGAFLQVRASLTGQVHGTRSVHFLPWRRCRFAFSV